MQVPELEHQIGVETYLTSGDGISGRIRQKAEDFVVEESLVDGSKATVEASRNVEGALGSSSSRHRFLLCVLVKRNWDTFKALKGIANFLNIGVARIQIAGIKDAKALTAQFVTLQGVSAEEAAALEVHDLVLRPVGYFREAMCPFYLLGNNFKISISQISESAETVQKRTAKALSEMEAEGGIPNFYGHQRFGTVRAITHLVGRAIVQGDLEEACMIFLAKPSPHEHPESRNARAELQKSLNFRQALKDFPLQLRYERIMLSHLAENTSDYLGAFRQLPLKLRILFVQAWQSYLFNRFLSARIKEGLTFNRAEMGEFVVSVERTGLPMPKAGKLVDATNIREINHALEVGKMRVALPIFGSRQKLSKGKMGEIQREILQEESADARDFRVQNFPELNAKGELRAAVCPVRDFLSDTGSESYDDELHLKLEFMLLKGAYATVLLREIMKPKHLILSGF